MIVGDFNVAPLECDVWSHKALINVVSHTPVEVDALNRLQQAHDWIDIGRKFIPAPERCYTAGGWIICGRRRLWRAKSSLMRY
jgi:exodeoxyribonuclease-3